MNLQWHVYGVAWHANHCSYFRVGFAWQITVRILGLGSKCGLEYEYWFHQVLCVNPTPQRHVTLVTIKDR
jgi:hypothetical protein